MHPVCEGSIISVCSLWINVFSCLSIFEYASLLKFIEMYCGLSHNFVT